MYKLIRPFVFGMDAERTHHLVTKAALLGRQSGIRELLEHIFSFEHPALEAQIFGLKFSNPVGLAGGYDKNGEMVDFLSLLGFGSIEVGTVTPRPQAGNPRPRLFHLVKEQALLNRMGFNNNGAQALAAKLQQRKTSIPLGANIAKSKDTPNESAIEDYVACFQTVSPFVDYIAINISSPNTPGLRELQDKAFLQELLLRLPVQKPFFIKIAPELSASQLDEILEVVMQRANTGIIATNTLKQSRPQLGDGGVSGKPLAKRSTEVIRYLYRQSQGKIPITGVGGIFSAEDAYEKITAGASLVQIYTGLVYEGPGLVKRIKKGLVDLLHHDGFSSIVGAVGKE